MSAILRLVADSISQKLGTQVTNLKRLDDAIRNGGVLYGEEMDISEQIHLGKSKAGEYVAELASLVGDGSDVDNIVLAGGGSQFFLDVVQAEDPGTRSSLPMTRSTPTCAGFRWPAKSG